MYELIGSVRSRAFRVLWMLEELGVPYTLTKAGPRSDEVRAHNPSGKVPVLVADGKALTDSTAILTFLADKHGQFTAPAGSLERAQQDGITQFLLDEMDAILWTAARHSFILPEERRVPEVKESLRWEWEESQRRLARLLGDGPFLTGADMSVADFIATHCLTWATNAKFSPPEGSLADYVAQMMSRPAYKSAQDK